MDGARKTVTEKLSSKRAMLDGSAMWILWDMAGKDPVNAIYYAAGIVALAIAFMVSEHIEKGRNGKGNGPTTEPD